MPKISVIIAVYNVEPYLRRSMDCLMNQTMKDLEFICIDDCSTDGSLAILKEYAQKDSRFKIIESQQNGGAAVARNKGLEVATGEYLGFIDPDDAIDLNYYEELYKKAKEDDYDIVKCNRTTIYKEKGIVSDLNQRILNNGLLFFSYEWTTAIYKSSIVFENNIQFPDEIRKGQDTVFLYRIVLKSKTIAIIDNVSYYYYKREGSLNAYILPLRNIESALKAMSVVCKEINESNLFEADCDKYIMVYKNKLATILKTFLYRNKSFKARLVCSEHLINNYHQCKDTNALRKIINPQWVVPYLEKKRTKLLALLFMLYKTKQELLCYKPIEMLFSLKNKKINKRKYKVLNILGIKIKIRK